MIVGYKDVSEELKNMSNVDCKGAIRKAIALVQAAAKNGLSAVNTGELRNSIFIGVESNDSLITGTCYTNKEYAPYVEFGTGPKGQESHEGVNPDIALAYRQSPWWIHESQIDKELAEKYHWFHIDTQEGRFYQCTGQPAQPFMYPALKNNEEEILRMIKEEVAKQL